MNISEFIEKKLKGTTKVNTHASVFGETDMNGNTTIYSYGYHYPLATIIDGKGFVNSRGYSNTTAKHINHALGVMWKLAGTENTYNAPLYDGNSLTKNGIINSAQIRLKSLANEMATKKRHNTEVYRQLQFQLDQITRTLSAAKEL